METMKAAAIRRPGGPEMIPSSNSPAPRRQPGEVVLAVRAAGLNHLDIWVRRGGRFQLTFPHVLGSDAAGVVAEVGPGVTGLTVGQEVVLSARACPAGSASSAGAASRPSATSSPSSGRAGPARSPSSWLSPRPTACPSRRT